MRETIYLFIYQKKIIIIMVMMINLQTMIDHNIMNAFKLMIRM